MNGARNRRKLITVRLTVAQAEALWWATNAAGIDGLLVWRPRAAERRAAMSAHRRLTDALNAEWEEQTA